jgi:hypothetical protein
VTAASDVYSLGAVLYELLTGSLPHRIEKSTPLALERAICLEPTAAPSTAVRNNRTLARRLAGDLDNIILCAMQKDPERRYTSAEHLAEDLQRYLEHRPVRARPDSPGYRAGKFIRRNRLPATLVGAATAAVVMAAGVATYEARANQIRFREAIRAERGLKRELAGAYARLGKMQSGTPEAVGTYAATVELTKTLWEADPLDARTLNDYGAAQLNLGLAMPLERAKEKRAALERTRDWLTGETRKNPTNAQLRQQLDTATAALAALGQGRTKP